MANAQTITLNLKAVSDFNDVTTDISQIQNMLNKIKVPQNLKNNFDGIFDDLTKETTRYQKLLDSGFKKKGDVTGLEASGQRINALLKRLKGEMGKVDGSMLEQSFQIDPSKIQELQNHIANLKSDLNNLMSTDPMQKLKQSAANAATELTKISKTKFTADFTEAFNKGDIDGAAQALQNLQANHKKFNDQTKENQFQKHIGDMKAALDQLSSNNALIEITQQIRQADQSLDNLDSQELQAFIQTFQQGRNNVEEFTQGVRTFTSETNRAATAQSQFSSEVDQLKSQVQYFFGMTNAVYLLRNALQSAFQTVKELDAVMTETAVVTDFTVGDMWEKLPEYTAEASKLGASVKDLYAATTLYYQQGLKTEAAMGVGIETMKMARIASMDATEATQAMTAALRGFGMAVNETNALRVNDVYSELAAITAADTEQIATAMSKTASIAAAANMEFETTAALLAQIIETTQEAPETAGTALKTIIARFSEVKKLQGEGKNTGEDEEGEAIDVNKIDKAMKAVGISMEGFFNGTEGLDSILLKLAEKWDSLDFTTQRYVATMAAGSRQQSRFIAMMSDYGRTTELVSAANSSAGASQEQFNKTLESMEAKLAKLSNAWDEFTMGIADNGLLKAGIDLLTKLLNTINDITGALPGAMGGIAKIGLLLLGLRAGGLIFDAFFINLKACGAPAQALGKTITGLGVKIKAAFSRKNFQFDKDLFKAKAALSQYNREQEKANLAKTQSAAITKTDTASLQEKATWDGIAANSTNNMTFAEQKYAAALGLSKTQAQIAMGLEQAGISTDMAAALAVEGMTAAELRNQAIKRLGIGAKEADIAATMKEIAAEKVGDKIRTKSLTTRIGETAQTILNTLAKWGLVPANTAAAFSEKVLGDEAMATGVKMLISLGIIGLVIAAVALLVVGIVALVKAFKNNTPEAKLKALQERADAAAESAEAAKTEYEELLSTIDEYDNIQETFEDLEEGTLEWAEAIRKANEQVLELIRNYPILANYMSMNENGVLQISQQGFDELRKQQMEQVSITQGIASLAQLDVMDSGLDNLLDQFKGVALNDTAKNQVKYYEGQNVSSLQYKDYTQAGGAKAIMEQIVTKYLANDLGALWDKNARIKVDEDFSKYLDETDTGTELSDEGKKRSAALGYSETDFLHKIRGTKNKEVYQYSDEIIKLADELGVTADELYAMRESLVKYGSQYKVMMAQQKAYTKALIANSLSSDVLNGSYGAGIVKHLGEALTPEKLEQIDNANEKEWAAGSNYNNSDNTTNENLKKKIQEFNAANPERAINITDKEKADMAAYYKALTGQETKHTGKTQDDEIAAEIAEAETAKQINDIGDRLYNIATNNVEAGQLLSGDLDTDYSGDIATNFGLDPENIDDEIIIDTLDDAYKKIEEKRKEINTELSNIFGEQTTAKSKFGSYKQASKFLTGYNSLVMMAGEQAGTLFADTFQAYAGKGLVESDQMDPNELLEEFSDIDWSSSIAGAAALKDMLENGSIAAKDFAARMMFIGPAAYSASAQFNELYNILGKETLADLGKDGQITASEITALGKECKEVATVLDTTGISASTLGTYFELLEEGIISTADASDAFLKSLEQLNAASNTIGESFSFMDNFEAARSQTEIGEYFQGMQEEIVSLFDKGAYGDQRLIDYVKAFVGEEDWGALVAEKGGSIKAALDEVMPTIKKYGKNMYGLWEQFAGMENGGMVSMGLGGAISFDLSKVGSIDQLKKELMSKLNISETIAEAMIADAQTFSDGLAKGFDALSLNEALGTLLSGALEVDGQKIISQSQLEAFAKEAGLDPKELEKAIAESGLEIKITPYLDLEGNLTDEIYTMIKEQLDETGDLSAAYALMLKLGMDDTKAKQTLTEMTTTLENAGTNIPFTVNGQQLKATGEVVDGVMEYSTESGTCSGTIGGIIDGLQDPEVVAQQELSALQQGQIQADAVATGTTAAAATTLASVAGMIDDMINETVDWVNDNFDWTGISIDRSNIAGKIDVEGMIEQSSAAATSYMSSRISAAQDRLDNAKKNKAEEGKIDGGKVMEHYDGEKPDAPGTESAYTGEESQTEYEGNGDKNDPWENTYDQYYNDVAKINAELRERERLEKEYSRLVNKRNKTAKDLVANAQAQLASLESERQQRQTLLENRKEEAVEIEKKYADVGDYAWYDQESGQVQIDWDLINELNGKTDEDSIATAERVEEFISKLEEQQGLIEEEADALDEINDTVSDIYEQGKSEYFDLEERTKDALIGQRQDEIDKLTEIDDSINNTNSKIIESIQSSIDEYRQNRDNEETESDIEEKQRRLAYLQQDSSGANALSILELQQEIDEAQEDYTDTLIDQKISELQAQNDEASKQRQKQIDLLQQQLKYYEDSEEVWSDVYALMENGIDENGIVVGSNLWNLLSEQEGYASMSALGQLQWGNELVDQAKQAVQWLTVGSSTKGLLDSKELEEGADIKFTTADGKTVSGKLQSDGSVVAEGKTYTGVHRKYNGSYITDENYKGEITQNNTANSNSNNSNSGTGSNTTKQNPYGKASETTGNIGAGATGDQVRSIQWALKQMNYDVGTSGPNKDGIDGSFGSKTTAAVKKFQTDSKIPADGIVGKDTRNAFKLKQYEKGGLADFTGPAWLDGTKSKPEYILNAEQTKAFFTLVDVLASFKNRDTETPQNIGESSYDIDINVENISSDYDVEQMAEKIKELIARESQYRNNNILK